jgi:hypothetical protein
MTEAPPTGIRMAEEALRRVFATGWDVRGRLPVALDDDSEPEPDISVVPGSFRDYPCDHPARAVLIVEISDTTLRLDRGEKGSLRARGLPGSGGRRRRAPRLALRLGGHAPRG